MLGLALISQKPLTPRAMPRSNFFLEFLGVPKTWCTALIYFLKGPQGFLAGNQQTEAAVHTGTGIKEGDTMSSTIFCLLTAILIGKDLHRFPQVQSFLFANDTLFFSPRTPGQARDIVDSLM